MKRKSKVFKTICLVLALCSLLTLTQVAILANRAEKVETPITQTEYLHRAILSDPQENRFWGRLGVGAYWLLSCTWGLLATAAGCIKALVCMRDGLQPKYFKGNIYFEHVGEQGSVNYGPFFFLGENAEYYTPYHEAGHGLQNILLGPLYVVVVGISSELWYNQFVEEYAQELASDDWDPDERRAAYDENPIERWATVWGAKVFGLELE